MQSRVPAVLSLHCHGTSDSFSPDDNRLVLQSEGAGNRFAQRERQEEQIFIKLYAALRSALTSFRWTTTNARPGEFFHGWRTLCCTREGQRESSVTCRFYGLIVRMSCALESTAALSFTLNLAMCCWRASRNYTHRRI